MMNRIKSGITSIENKIKNAIEPKKGEQDQKQQEQEKQKMLDIEQQKKQGQQQKDINLLKLLSTEDQQSLENQEANYQQRINEYLQQPDNQGNQAKPDQIERFKLLFNNKLKEVKQVVADQMESLDNNAKKFFEAQKHKMNTWIRVKMLQVIMNYIQKQPDRIKKALKDEHMFEFVKRGIDDLIDDLWPDIEEEIMYQFQMEIFQADYDKIEPYQRGCCCVYYYHRFLGWFLGSIYPYNKCSWQQMRTFSFWFFVLVKMVPVYGVLQAYYIIFFLLMDKSDEYQLIHFILNFKLSQFATMGIINALLNYLLIQGCSQILQQTKQTSLIVTNSNNQSTNINSSFSECVQSIYTNDYYIFNEVIPFLLQMVLGWIAFLMLSNSKQKGKPKFRYIQTVQLKELEKDIKSGNQSHYKGFCCDFSMERGGRIKAFMFYDFVAFLFCLSIFIVMIIFKDNYDKSYVVNNDFQLIKCLYGLLSFPFAIFYVPYLKQILTRSRRTGYDKYGRCRPYKQHIDQKHEDYKKQSKEQTEKLFKTVDIEDLYTKDEKLEVSQKVGAN